MLRISQMPWAGAYLYPFCRVCYNALRPTSGFERIILNAATREPLARAIQDQDEMFSSAFVLLGDAIGERVFPAASVAVTKDGKLVALKAFGRLVYTDDLAADQNLSETLKSNDFPVAPSTLFDVASLTKAVATTTMAAILYERGVLELDAPVAGIIPELVTSSGTESDRRRSKITFRMLLGHSSGLPAYEKLFLRAQNRKQLLEATFSTPLTADPGTRAEYSDIGFIILGVALERMAQESLASFCQREVFGPLGMTSTTFNPPAGLRAEIPPTADERAQGLGIPSRSTFRKRIIQGEVQDENASVLGGIAGHAGLFSTAEDLARFAHVMLCGGRPVLRQDTVGLFTKREPSPPGTSRTLGWDTPSSPSQSGKYFGARSFGHLGYTGTSFWIDPERALSVILLTNRTWLDCSNQAIKQVRPKFHDAVIEALRAE